MSDNVRQNIVDAIDARLKLIRTGHVFTIPATGRTRTVVSDIGAAVFPWRKTTVADGEAALCFYDLDADTTAEGVEYGKDEHSLRVRAVVYLHGKSTAPQARTALADLTAAIGADPKWSGLARWTEITGHAVAMEQDGQIVGGVTLDFRVVYRTHYFEI